MVVALPEHFDVVSDRLMLSNLRHPAKIERYLRAVHRLLSPDGVFVLRYGTGDRVGDRMTLASAVDTTTRRIISRLFEPPSGWERSSRFTVIPMLPDRGYTELAALLVLRPRES